MSRKIKVIYDPTAHPSIEISVDKNGDPKTDLLIFCDVIVTMIKLLDDQGLQKDHESMKIVTDRVNKGFMEMEKIVAESYKNDEPEPFNRPTEDPPKPMFDFNNTPPAPLPGYPQLSAREPTKAPDEELVGDINIAINKQAGKITFGHLLGIVENVKMDIWFQHYRKQGLI